MKIYFKNTILLLILFGCVAQINDIVGSDKVRLVTTATFTRFELVSLMPCATEQFARQIERKQKQIVKTSFYDIYKKVTPLRQLLDNGKFPSLTSEQLAFLARGEAIPCTNAACTDAACKQAPSVPIEIYCTFIVPRAKKSKKMIVVSDESLLLNSGNNNNDSNF